MFLCVHMNDSITSDSVLSKHTKNVRMTEYAEVLADEILIRIQEMVINRFGLSP